MAKKKFSYRGHSIEELKKMKKEEFATLLPSRPRRSLLRTSPEKHEKLMIKIEKAKKGESVKLNTHCRDVVITPDMVGLEFQVYNGRGFLPLKVIPEMLGHYMGEFAPTRKRVRHGMPGIGATKSSLYIPLK